MGPSRVPCVTTTSYSILMDVGPICQSRRQIKVRRHEGGGVRESENNILQKNSVQYHVTGLRIPSKGLCTYVYIYVCICKIVALGFLSPLPLF